MRCIVLTGSDKAFAAGADIKMMSDKSFVDVFSEDLFGPKSDAITRIRKPIIAAVSGYALGGGCELAMMCDFIIASDTAKFGQPEINLGVMAGHWRQPAPDALHRQVQGDGHEPDRPLHGCRRGRTLGSRQPRRAGQEADGRGALGRRQDRREIHDLVMAVKEAVNRAYETTLREGLLFERRVFHSLFATEDQAEGMAAFIEKREAQFRDK